MISWSSTVSAWATSALAFALVLHFSLRRLFMTYCWKSLNAISIYFLIDKRVPRVNRDALGWIFSDVRQIEQVAIARWQSQLRAFLGSLSQLHVVAWLRLRHKEFQRGQLWLTLAVCVERLLLSSWIWLETTFRQIGPKRATLLFDTLTWHYFCRALSSSFRRCKVRCTAPCWSHKCLTFLRLVERLQILVFRQFILTAWLRT